MISAWKNALKQSIDISVLTKTLPDKGNLVYEYNPFRNYRLTLDMYEYNDKLYNEDELKFKFGIVWDDNATENEVSYEVNTKGDFVQYTEPVADKIKKGYWVKNKNKQDNIITYNLVDPIPTPRLKGELVDFVTDELDFDLSHPVTIIPLYSYDGSVNLIFTDGKNQPRMINSRFSATGKDTYSIEDRKGSNDTNIYDLGSQFDVDTSLYKRVKQIPKLTLKSVTSGGALKCGNYHFYFKLADADGNETDFIAESGLVSIFVGENNPSSIYSGNKNENTVKQVTFLMTNIDPSYSYVYVYYSRATAELGDNRSLFYKKIDRKFIINNTHEALILVNGFDEEVDIAPEDINLLYNVVDAANCAVTAQSMLFLGNVHKSNIPYEELTDLSLRFLPYLKDENYELDIDEEYHINSISKGYYDPIYIYNNVGYWNKELYRLGVVYILSNGELSPVFNIRGRENIGTFTEYYKKDENDSLSPLIQSYDAQYTHYEFTNDRGEDIRIKYNESNNLIIKPNALEGKSDCNALYENIKGVISLNSNNDTKQVHAIEIRVEKETIERLKLLGIKGYFFVRQTRMPTVLAEGITIGIDKEGRVPTIPTTGGILSELYGEIKDRTYVETKDIYKHNYVSEGFLSRYTFDLKPTGSSLWSKIGDIALVTAVVVGVAAASIVTCGGAAAAAIATAASTATGAIGVTGLSAVGAATLVGAAAGAAVAAGTTAVVATGQEIGKAINRTIYSAKLEGRNTKVRTGYKRVETDDSRLLGASFKDRIIIKDYTKNDVAGIICPDYDVAPQVYNLLFTGGDFRIRTSQSQARGNYYEDLYDNQTTIPVYSFDNNERHLYMPWGSYSYKEPINYLSKLQAVPDGVECVTIGKTKFRSKAGSDQEAWRYECIGDDFKQVPSSFGKENVEQSSDTSLLTDDQIKKEIQDKQINSDIVRGAYGPYIGMTGYGGCAGETVQIMVPGYKESNMQEYFQIRMQDVSPFYAISDRYDLNNLNEYYIHKSNLSGDSKEDLDCKFVVHRGDCYICQFTHRVIRNFNDPSAPYNSEIVNSKSWKDHYLIEKSQEFEKINLGDVNAVNLGMWVTFTIRSNRNLNVRSLDGSVITEVASMGHPRGFFPYHGMIADGAYKSSEALVYNDGFSKNLSERYNFQLPDSPYIRNWYGTRIMYSDIHINDGYKNGYRVFLGLNYRDYTRLYGSIIKLLNFGENLFVVFEHGLALIPINERAVAAQGSGGLAYINTANVLPENPKIISESYGSLWADSVIITPQDGQFGLRIFGVDTSAKKIWMFDGSQLKVISDLKVQEFLNLNITLTEREKTPILGIRNVKTVYNAFKHDVMFTFYDNLRGTEEKVWNLCYNLVLDKFITFYSWVPSYMENINNIPFSFDRNVSKWIAKLGQSHSDNSFAEGIVLSNNVYNDDGTVDAPPYINYRYLAVNGEYKNKKVEFSQDDGLIGVFNLLDHVLPQGENVDYFVKFDILRDIYGYYKDFTIKEVGTIKLTEADLPKYKNSLIKVYGLYFSPQNGDITAKTENRPIYNITGTEDSNIFTLLGTSKNRYFAELYYRNKAGHKYNDYDDYKVTIQEIDPEHCTIELDNSYKKLLNTTEDSITLTRENYFDIVHRLELPIFHSRDGKRPTLPTPINKRNLVQMLNIRATIYARYCGNSTDDLAIDQFYRYIKAQNSGNIKDLVDTGSGWFSAGIYESSIAVTSKWNLKMLDSSFWKHGQAGSIDITEPICPTKWYGEQHPFEFEVVVVNDPGVHKIFQNLEIISNKAKPESFHFEVIGDAYDFAKDKPNMYFRQEARKALFQYNGADITYDRNFRKINPKQLPKSAELIHNYYERQDTIDEIKDSYVLGSTNDGFISATSNYDAWAKLTPNKDYRHLSGAEIVYYPNRQEYRVWQHQPAIDLDELPSDSATSFIRSNCQYIEDKWRVSINPLLICYKNEYVRRPDVPGVLCLPLNSIWPNAMTGTYNKSETRIPPITIKNTCIPAATRHFVSKNAGNIIFPNELEGEGKDSGLFGLYSWDGHCPIDNTNWLEDVNIYQMHFGEAQNRKETDIRDKFVKVRIRYSGEELAVIDFLNTIYTVSYA